MIEDLHVELLKGIRDQKMIEIQEILAHCKIENIDIINYQIDFQPIHQAVWLGNERIILLLLSENASFAATTNKQMDCLTLAVYRKHYNIVKMIISRIENPNYLSRYGTALHIAAQSDDLEIIQILLQHPSIDIYAKFKGQIPREVAGPKTRKILQLEEREQSSISQITSYLSLTDNQINSFVVNQPEAPPIVMGDVWKISIKGFAHNRRFIVIDCHNGILCRYTSREEYPIKAIEVIPLESIRQIHLHNNYWFAKPDLNYLKITYQKKQEIFIAFRYIQVARYWQEMIEKAMAYYKYIQSQTSIYQSNGELKKMQKLIANDTLHTPITMIEILDQPVLRQKQHIKDMQQLKKSQYSPQMEIVSEQSQNEDEQLQARVLSDFKVIGCIGKGSFGYVYQVEYKNKLYALKQQDKMMLVTSDNLRYALAEVNILKKLYHPFIVNGLMAFQTNKYLYLLLEFCPGGDLAMYMTRGVILNERVAKILIGQIILAIEYLHSKDILYRDLKPENIAIAQDGNLKLIDFGLSTIVKDDNLTYTICGSPAYLAPEILLNQGCSKQTDIYQIGLLLYEMLTGFPPFYTKEINVLLQSIKQQTVSMPKSLSEEAKDLLGCILKRNPERRISIPDMKKHIFFGDISWEKLEAKQYKLPALQKHFQQSQRANGVLADSDVCQDGYVQCWDFTRC